MAVDNSRAERAPLIHRSTSVRAIYPKDDETEAGISTLRGAFIISSIGLLIFLQGTQFLYNQYRQAVKELIAFDQIFKFLPLSAGVVLHELDKPRHVHAC